MSRKIFISILGIGYYQQTKYKFKEIKNNSDKSTNFIQESTLLQLARDWSKMDRSFIFLTEKARKDNWNSPAQVDNKFVKEGKSKSYAGLKEVIENNKFNFELHDVNIPDGNSEEEIWQIFETVYNVIQKGDELYFDVTHAFRSIPMLVMVLVNYAKLLKNINVKSITYGNFMAAKEGIAPVDELTSFSQLQDWTNATNLFVNHGNLDALSSLTKQEITPVLSETKGKDKTASELRKISEILSKISLALKTNNVPDINQGLMFAEFKQSLSQIENDLIKPLNPVLDKIEEKISEFSITEDVMNGIKAVDFCLDSGLIQQAYTMLQESIISIVLDSEKLDIKNVGYRDIVSGCFKINKENYPTDKWKDKNFQNQYLTKTILKNDLLTELSSSFNSLTEKRNIINHAGFNEKSSTKVFRNLERDIIDLNNRVKNKISTFKKINDNS